MVVIYIFFHTLFFLLGNLLKSLNSVSILEVLALPFGFELFCSLFQRANDDDFAVNIHKASIQRFLRIFFLNLTEAF